MSRQMRGGDMMILYEFGQSECHDAGKSAQEPGQGADPGKGGSSSPVISGAGSIRSTGKGNGFPMRPEHLSSLPAAPRFFPKITFTVQDFPDAPKAVPDDPRELPPEPVRRVELYFDGLVTRGVVPVPGNTYRLDAVADDAEITNHGIFSLKTVEK